MGSQFIGRSDQSLGLISWHTCSHCQIPLNLRQHSIRYGAILQIFYCVSRIFSWRSVLHHLSPAQKLHLPRTHLSKRWPQTRHCYVQRVVWDDHLPWPSAMRWPQKIQWQKQLGNTMAWHLGLGTNATRHKQSNQVEELHWLSHLELMARFTNVPSARYWRLLVDV